MHCNLFRGSRGTPLILLFPLHPLPFVSQSFNHILSFLYDAQTLVPFLFSAACTPIPLHVKKEFHSNTDCYLNIWSNPRNLTKQISFSFLRCISCTCRRNIACAAGEEESQEKNLPAFHRNCNIKLRICKPESASALPRKNCTLPITFLLLQCTLHYSLCGIIQCKFWDNPHEFQCNLSCTVINMKRYLKGADDDKRQCTACSIKVTFGAAVRFH